MARLLGAVRLSRETNETSSPARQRDQISLTAQVRGDELIYVAEDLDVSGAVSAWNRDLEPWLTDTARIAQWDSLIVSKLDRLTRSLLDFQRLLAWCDQNSKGIISVSEGFDLSTPVGRLIANVLIMFAEFERTRMGERRADRARDDKARGWYGGGRYAYGKRPVQVDDHWELEVDPARKAIVDRMANDILAGKSASKLAKELNEENVPSAIGGTWASTTVLNILRSPDSVLDTGTWQKLQPKLAKLSKGKGRNRYDATKLLGVVFCGVCNSPLYGSRSGNRPYYRCYRRCGARMIPTTKLEKAVDEALVDTYGWLPYRKPRLVPGAPGKAKKLAELDRSITSLDQDDPEYDSKHTMLREERRRVKDAPSEPDRWVPEDTGLKIAKYWASLAQAAKRNWLLDNDWRVFATAGERGADPVVTIEPSEYWKTVEGLLG